MIQAPAISPAKVADAPLWTHALAAFLILGLGLVTLRPFGAVVTDEGAAVLQAQHLLEGRGWLTGWSDPSLDPDGSATLVPNGDWGSRGRAFYAKHPLYPVLLAGAKSTLGTAGYFLLSILGTVIAGWAAGGLAQMVRRRAGPLALWGTVLATPLLYYAYVVLAHSLAAAASAVAVWGAAKFLAGQSRILAATAVATSCAFAPMIRSEGAFLGPALAVASLVVARKQGRSAFVVSGAAGLGWLIGLLVDMRWAASIVGARGLPATNEGVGYLEGRISGFGLTWLRPSYYTTSQDVTLMLALLLIVFAAVLWRRGSKTPADLIWWGVFAAYATGAWLAAPSLIPGLLFTLPVVLFAVLTGQFERAASPARLCLMTAGLIAFAVIATQYSKGGGADWGGRFFALAVPLVVAPVAIALAGTPWTMRLRAATAAVTALLSAWVWLVVHEAHIDAAEVDAMVRKTEAAYRNPQADRHDVVFIFVNPLLPQAVWSGVDVRSWLAPESGDLIPTVEEVVAQRPGAIAVVTHRRDEKEFATPPQYQLTQRTAGEHTNQVVLVYTPGP